MAKKMNGTDKGAGKSMFGGKRENDMAAVKRVAAGKVDGGAAKSGKSRKG